MLYWSPMKRPGNSAKPKNFASNAFTLVELMVVLAVIIIIVGIGVPALRNSRQDSIVKTSFANAKTLNDARVRAILNGSTEPTLEGDDVLAAANYLVGEGFKQLA